MSVLEGDFGIEYSEELEKNIKRIIQSNIDAFIKRLHNDFKLADGSKIYKAFLNIRYPKIIYEFEEGDSIQSISQENEAIQHFEGNVEIIGGYGTIFIDTNDGGKENSNIYSIYSEADVLLIKEPKYADGGRVWNDEDLLKRYKRRESIGFSAISHLKSKGLIKRADGTKRKSMK